MSGYEAACLPPEVLDGRPVAWLLRHAARPPLPVGLPGDEVGLTPEGTAATRVLGTALRGRVGGLWSSPVRRCQQTAALLQETAGADIPVHEDSLLGAPGVFVQDAVQAWESWLRLGNEGVIEHLMRSEEPLPGFAVPAEAARRLVEHLLRGLRQGGGVHVFVTHDSVLVPAVSRWLGGPPERMRWPDFLEGAFVWEEAGRTVVRYRDEVDEVRLPPSAAARAASRAGPTG